MAEFCLECFKKIDGDKSLTEDDVILSDDLCEGCGEWKPCVIRVKTNAERFSLSRLIKDLFS